MKLLLKELMNELKSSNNSFSFCFLCFKNKGIIMRFSFKDYLFDLIDRNPDKFREYYQKIFNKECVDFQKCIKEFWFKIAKDVFIKSYSLSTIRLTEKDLLDIWYGQTIFHNFDEIYVNPDLKQDPDLVVEFLLKELLWD